jgi:murein DD-endopeptidase MepM/ murein hydrolase activator NlpD
MTVVAGAPPFRRPLKGGEIGSDVEGIGRALCRAPGISYVPLRVFAAMPAPWRRTYGDRKRDAVNRIRRLEKWGATGVYDVHVHDWLIDEQAFDAKATNLVVAYQPPAALVFPLPIGAGGSVCQGLHATAGLPGNWAIDFCGAPGTPVLAVEDAYFYRYSGHDPSDDTADSQGVFGWTIYLQTRAGVIYFVTHLGWRESFVAGQRVRAGEIIGRIGNQRYRPDHTHYGATHPEGSAAAKSLMLRIASSPRVRML